MQLGWEVGRASNLMFSCFRHGVWSFYSGLQKLTNQDVFLGRQRSRYDLLWVGARTRNALRSYYDRLPLKLYVEQYICCRIIFFGRTAVKTPIRTPPFFFSGPIIAVLSYQIMYLFQVFLENRTENTAPSAPYHPRTNLSSGDKGWLGVVCCVFCS